jgi:hypothetical protein
MADKAEKKQYELPPLKVEPVDGNALNKLRLQQKNKGVPVSDTAISMSDRMLKDQASGARIQLSTKVLQDNRENIKRTLRRDLEKCAKRAGHKNVAVRVIDDKEKPELVFFYEPRRVQAQADVDG